MRLAAGQNKTELHTWSYKDMPGGSKVCTEFIVAQVCSILMTLCQTSIVLIFQTVKV